MVFIISWLSLGFGWDSSIETSTTGGEKNPGGVADLDVYIGFNRGQRKKEDFQKWHPNEEPQSQGLFFVLMSLFLDWNGCLED